MDEQKLKKRIKELEDRVEWLEREPRYFPMPQYIPYPVYPVTPRPYYEITWTCNSGS